MVKTLTFFLALTFVSFLSFAQGGMKLYKNETHKITLSYPHGWNEFASPKMDFAVSPEKDSVKSVLFAVSVRTIKGSERQTVLQNFEKELQAAHPGMQLTGNRTYNIKGREIAERYYSVEKNGKVLIVSAGVMYSKGRYYLFQNIYPDSQATEYKAKMKMILDNVKFM